MGDIVEIVSGLITLGVALFIVNRLLEILRTLRLEAPFVKENAVRFRRVGFALIIGEVSKIALGIMGAIFDADIDKSIEITNLMAIAAVFVLSEVFLEGSQTRSGPFRSRHVPDRTLGACGGHDCKSVDPENG